MANFDPDKFINCKQELELFKKVLLFKDRVRILTIKAESGRGKSQLLEKLKHFCQTGNSRPIPVSLISVKQGEVSTPIAFVKTLSEDMKNQNVKFDHFHKADTARMSGIFSNVATLASEIDIKGYVNLQGAHIDKGAVGNDFAGVMTKIENNFPEGTNIDASVLASALNNPRLSEEHEKFAQTVCIEGFQKDILRYFQRSKQPLVIMIDAYEQCESVLQSWILQEFCGQYFFDKSKRQKRIVLVVAGQEVPQFHHRWPKQECDNVVQAIDGLRNWSEEDVQNCMKIYGIPNEPLVTNLMYHLGQNGASAISIVNAAQVIRNALTSIPTNQLS